MVLKEGEYLRCPKCGGKMFIATAHVSQYWVMNEYGAFQNCLNDCVEVTHEPDQGDIWDCQRCGFSGAGREFIAALTETDAPILDETRVAECVYDISLMAQHMIEERRIVVEDSRELFDSVFEWAKEFETAWGKCKIEGDYMEKIEEFAAEKLLAVYCRKSQFKPKVIMAQPAALACGLIADLGNGSADGGDRASNYFEIARDVGDDDNGSVCVSLVEMKHGIPESEWGYCLHVINDVDGGDCELYHTDHLSKDELADLLGSLMEKMKKGEM